MADENSQAAKTPAPTKAVSAPQPINIDEIVDTWASDLAGNIPALRETTEAYNKFRAATDALKSELENLTVALQP